MRILIDTHVLLCELTDEAHLSQDVRMLLPDVWISEEKLPLVTADPHFERYPVEVIW